MDVNVDDVVSPAPASRLKSFNYAIGMFGTSIPINLLKTFAAGFYVIGLGLTTSQFALILLIYAWIDAADNPIYGYLSDRTRSRWGRRKPWLVIATPLLVLGLIAFFSPPTGMAGAMLLGYCMLFYIFTGTIDSVINANYGALFPEMFRTDAQRASTNALRQAFQLVAMIISIAATPIVTGAIGYKMTAIIYGLIGGVVILYMALTSREVKFHEDEQKPDLLNSLKDLAANRKFWLAGISNAFYSAAMSLVLVAVPFFAVYTLKINDLQKSLMFAAVLLIAIGCVAVWAKLVKRYGLIPVWRVALITLTIAFIPMYFANSFILAIVCGALIGFGFAGAITTIDLIGAKIMDEDTAKYNLRREGIISNAMGFMNRLNSLFTAAAFFLVGKLFGFVSGDVPGPRPDQAARFLLSVFPCALALIAFVFSFFVDFKETALVTASEEAV